MYCYVWEFVVRPERLRDFETAYGAEGDWAQLFRRDPAYVRTLLLKDRESPTRFVTVDFWSSPKACMAFRERFAAEFEALDSRFEEWTLRETHMGDFDVVGWEGQGPQRNSGLSHARA